MKQKIVLAGSLTLTLGALLVFVAASSIEARPTANCLDNQGREYSPGACISDYDNCEDWVVKRVCQDDGQWGPCSDTCPRTPER